MTVNILLELGFYKLHEILSGIEVVIDGGETDIGDFIDIPEAMEDVFPDTFRGNPFFITCPFALEFIDHLFDFYMIHIPLIKRHKDASLHLGSVVEFFGSVRFDYEEIDELESFKCRETGFTFLTLTSTTDGLPVFRDTGVDNLGIEIFTFWTAHTKEIRSRGNTLPYRYVFF